MIAFQHNFASLQRTLARYGPLVGKTPREVLLKKGGDLGFAVSGELHKLAPVAGEIRAERLAALRAGRGIRISDKVEKRVFAKLGVRIRLRDRARVFGKSKKGEGHISTTYKGVTRNLQARLTEAEINSREKASHFLGISARYPKTLKERNKARSKKGFILSVANLNGRADTLTFTWSPGITDLSGEAGAGLSKPAAQSAIAHAIQKVDIDTQAYITRKLVEKAGKAGFK